VYNSYYIRWKLKIKKKSIKVWVGTAAEVR